MTLRKLVIAVWIAIAVLAGVAAGAIATTWLADDRVRTCETLNARINEAHDRMPEDIWTEEWDAWAAETDKLYEYGYDTGCYERPYPEEG